MAGSWLEHSCNGTPDATDAQPLCIARARHGDFLGFWQNGEGQPTRGTLAMMQQRIELGFAAAEPPIMDRHVAGCWTTQARGCRGACMHRPTFSVPKTTSKSALGPSSMHWGCGQWRWCALALRLRYWARHCPSAPASRSAETGSGVRAETIYGTVVRAHVGPGGDHRLGKTRGQAETIRGRDGSIPRGD